MSCGSGSPRGDRPPPVPPVSIPRLGRTDSTIKLQESPALTGLSGMLESQTSVVSPKPWELGGAAPTAGVVAAAALAGKKGRRSNSVEGGGSSLRPIVAAAEGEGVGSPKRKHDGTSPVEGSRLGFAAAAAAQAELSEEPSERGEAPRPASPTKRQRPSISEQRQPAQLTDIFAPGMMPGRVFRIPSLLPLPDGVVLAFSEARENWHDTGRIDLVMRRSRDGGATWGAVQVILTGASLKLSYVATVGNPCAVYDAHTGVVWMLLCSNHGRDSERAIHARQSVDRFGRRVWVTSSKDMGCTWADPTEITKTCKRSGWTWYATGPGIGVQLQNGRLLIPANHAEDVEERRHPFLHDLLRSRMVAHALYSDDHGARRHSSRCPAPSPAAASAERPPSSLCAGASWHLGAIAAPHTNESALAQLPSGVVVFSARDWSGEFRRQVQLSRDGGSTLEAARYDWTLTEPEPWGCQASLLALPAVAADARGGLTKQQQVLGREAPAAADDSGILFFCNPSSPGQRAILTVRRSDDGGRSWPLKYVLDDGKCAYSSLGRLRNGSLGVLYERGESISLAVIPPSADGPLGLF